MATEPKTERIELRMSPLEASMLRELADADGLSQANVVRLLERREHAARFPATTPKRPAKR